VNCHEKDPDLPLAPRILCILSILFVSIFALDAFNPENTIGEQIGDFLMHMIPSFVLTIILVLAWKWEKLGGILFTIIGVGLSPFVFFHNYRMNESIWLSLSIILVVTIPFAVIGVLFLMSHRMKQRDDGCI
jgi:ABC-type multidrug transport system fused ATPase/permease subunit